ncbi:MAG: 2,3-bisphosphoglycerate-independent phosphoglycerate mutase [Amphritea sp.]
MHTKKSTSVLLILDGWGCREETTSNAIAQANTPNWDRLVDEHPSTQVLTSGAAVGLPDGQMGNSEVGHMNIGAGRVIYQNFTRINKAISDGSFSTNPRLCDALKSTQARSGALHIMGLLSPGGVHSHEEHFKAVFDLACEKGIQSIYFHLFLDGRDTPPRSAKNSIEFINSAIEKAGKGQIASLCGRYYAMDRDQRWDRTEDTYRLIVEGQGKHQYESALVALDAAYEARNENDEFVQPTAINNADANPITASSDDTLIFMNFRPDRARQLTQAFVDSNLDKSWQSHVHPKDRFLTLTHYSDNLDVQVLFPSKKVENSLGEHLSHLGMTQLRIAETEKYAHVTYFFNGGKEQPFKGEDRILVPSPDVATYDLQPEMNCQDVTEKLVAAINSQTYDLIVCNYANGDMVGHSGNLEAAIKAVEAVDSCLGQVVPAVKEINGNCIITADHGNVELMHDPKTGAPHTSHTNLPVPLILISEAKRKLISSKGVLADIAPTLLDLMGLEKPEDISGTSLLS